MSGPQDYTVGWVCALPLEMAAAKGMLDQVHPNLSEQNPADHNSYILGQIQGHNVVIACLPAGIYGTTTAATVAKDMLRTFKSIRFGLMVGIGGGAPSSIQDIRLGDVVVGQPTGSIGGIIQYDRGKTVRDGGFQRTGSLNTPPQVLLSALGRLRADHLIEDSQIPRFLTELVEKSPKKMKKKFGHQGSSKDYLFRTGYEHEALGSACDQCDSAEMVQRDARDDTDPVIHYGNIASGNQVIKHGETRDRLSGELGVLCFETEAAGLQDFPSLVIRGICDYADSHKNKVWQEYAAATAAAFAKELLSVVTPERVLQDKPVPQLVSDPRLCKLVSRTNVAMSEQTLREDNRYEIRKQVACHQAFKTSTYEAFKNLNPDRVPGTCKWVLEHQRYIKWQQSPYDGLLWISADPGCGKSVLAKSLIDGELRRTDEHTVLYFFFKDNDEQNNLATALCALLHQLFHFQPLLLHHAMGGFAKNGAKLQKELDELWRILLAASMDDQAKTVTCVLDALDECCVRDRHKLLHFLTNFHNQQAPSTRKSRLKFLVTSRPYQDIESEFRGVPESQLIRLAGEESNTEISREINLVIREKVATIGRKLQMEQQVQDALQQTLLAVPHRTYLWLYLVIEEIYSSPKRTKKALIKSINSVSTTVEDAYEKILARLKYNQRDEARTLLHIVVGAQRPLNLSEMDVAFQIATDSPDAKAHEELDLDYNLLKSRIRELCGLFVFVNYDRIYLIHQTAKEFLISRDCLPCAVGSRWKHSLNSQDSDTKLTQICVQYLSFRDIKDNHLYPSRREADVEVSAYPLLEYAAVHWPAHLRNIRSIDEELLDRIFGLYDTHEKRFQIWFPRFWEVNHPFETNAGITNVHAAALNGHDKVLSRLLDLDQTAINTKDGDDRTPLMWGCLEGHDGVVQVLLDKGANINKQGCRFGDALQAPSSHPYGRLIQRHLDQVTDANLQSGKYSDALQVASFRGHNTIVQMLLDKGANVNAQGGFYGNALQAALTQGYEKVVQMLVDKGANVNAQGGFYSNALQAASFEGHDKIVHILLNEGADINRQDGKYGNALQAASFQGHIEIVQTLLVNGADVNAQGGFYGNALQAASLQGQTRTVHILLDKGADVNAQGGFYGNALLAASLRGHNRIIQVLLDKGGYKLSYKAPVS